MPFIFKKIISTALLNSLKKTSFKDQEKIAGLLLAYINSRASHLEDSQRQAIGEKIATEIALLAENKPAKVPTVTTVNNNAALYLELNNNFLFFPNQYQEKLKEKSLTTSDIEKCLLLLNNKIEHLKENIATYNDPQTVENQIADEWSKLQQDFHKDLPALRTQLTKLEKELVKEAFLFFKTKKKELAFICHQNIIDNAYNQLIKDKHQRKKYNELQAMQFITQKTIKFFDHYNIVISRDLLPNNYAANMIKKLVKKNCTIELNLFLNYLKEIYLSTIINREYHKIFKKVLNKYPLATKNISLNEPLASFLEKNTLLLFKKGVFIRNFANNVLNSVYKNVFYSDIKKKEPFKFISSVILQTLSFPVILLNYCVLNIFISSTNEVEHLEHPFNKITKKELLAAKEERFKRLDKAVKKIYDQKALTIKEQLYNKNNHLAYKLKNNISELEKVINLLSLLKENIANKKSVPTTLTAQQNDTENILEHLYQKADGLISYYQKQPEIETAIDNKKTENPPIAEIKKLEPGVFYTINGPFQTVLKATFTQKLLKQKELALLENNILKALNKGIVRPVDEIGIKIFYQHKTGKKIAEIKFLGVYGNQRIIGLIDESNGTPQIIFNKYLKKK